MAVRILNGAQVAALLPMADCIDVMADALGALAAGDALLPLRSILRLPDGGRLFGVMPAHLGRPEALGLKAIAVFPANEGTRYDSHQGLVVLFDPTHGFPIAIMDAASVTAIRTAAVSGLATRVLARPDAGDLALLGSGVQARTHLEAMAAVRPLRRVRAWSPSADRLRAFAGWAGTRFGPAVEPVASADEAVRGADIVCAVTSAREPVVRSAAVSDGAHLNAVGSSLRTARELDTATMLRGRLIVDRRESALAEAGDLLIPMAEGALTEAHIAGELGDVVLGRVPGRRSPGEVTIFKSLGIAIEDLAAGTHVLRQAEAQGIGLVTELGGLRE